MVSVDLDRASPVLLLRAYLCAKHMFPDVPIEVFVSPSGVGFHMKIDKEVTIPENLKIRALLWDEPYRLYYALKKWALNPQEQYIDLVFDEKNDGKERLIDLEAMLQPYKKEVQKIEELVQNGETEKGEELVQKVAKQIEPQLAPYKKPQYVGCIALPEDLREKLESICADIANKDTSFKYRFYPSFYPQHDWLVCVFDSDKDRVWKRLTWLKNKTPLKDVNVPLWVKERVAT